MCGKLIYLVAFFGGLSLGLTCPANAGPIGHWTFDEGVGDVAHDSSGNNNDGTLLGNPVWVTGKIGSGALSFDNTDDILIIGYDPSLDLENELTIALWVKAPDVVTPNHMVTKQPSGTAPDNYPGNYEFRIKNDTIQFLHQTSEGTDYSEYHSTLQITVDEWHHAAMTVVEGELVEFYLDGVSAGSTEQLGTFGMLNDGPLRIGGRKDDRFFNGILDDIYIYARALTAHQIEGLSKGIEPMFTKSERPVPEDGVLHAETWVNLGWQAGEFAVSHDVYIGDNFDDVDSGVEGTFVGNQDGTFIVVGFPGFPFPDGLVPGTTYYWRIDEVNDAEPNSPWKGPVWSFSTPPKTAYFPDPADGAESVALNAELSWTGGYGSKLHTVYFGETFEEVDNATGGSAQGSTEFTPGPLKLAKTYYWRVDEFDVIETYKGEVWSFTTEGAVGSPEPANGAVDVKQTAILSWTPGVFAASHELYFGTDKDAVKNADTGSPEYKSTRDLGAESYDPGMLEWDNTYYWRIDEVNNTNPDSPWPGILWSFTTANFLVVDDFESYNDIDPPDPESNRIFEAWIDGYEIPTNGALVGNDLPPYAEQTIVHGGNQSMPLFYDNSVGYSEATLTLTYPRDWTEKGVSTLTIWFRGDSDNAAETLYAALNGSAVVNHDNPDAAQINRWTKWNIDLQAFVDQGVNLANVNTISLGLGNKNNPLAGGSGTMYFDDIRLYPPPDPIP
jgi:hypothetical protein